VPDLEVAHGHFTSALIRSTLHSFLRDSPMFDEMWQEIQDAPGEIFDIPELRDLDDDKFDYNEYILSNIDY